MIPIVIFPGTKVSGVATMSDTMFMAKKAFDGKVITVTGAINALANEITYVVPNGKTFYFHSAKIVITGHPSIGTTANATHLRNQVQAQLKIDGTVVDTVDAGAGTWFNSDAAGEMAAGISMSTVPFDVKGRFLEGDGTKDVAIENSLDDGSAIATIIGWIETTNSTPVI